MAKYQISLPLEVDQTEEERNGEVKVAFLPENGRLMVETVAIKKGRGTATATFDKEPGSVQVMVGPATAENEDITAVQTLDRFVHARDFQESPELKLQPLLIPPYYWHWWRLWCRKYTITGRVICPDGSPVPGATVCAYDRDYWFFWSSKQQVGCATTDQNGTFTISFYWCCGWWPIYWWQRRKWYLEHELVDAVIPELQWALDKERLIRPASKPDLGFFEELLGVDRLAEENMMTRVKRIDADRYEAKQIDPDVLEALRKPLIERFPLTPRLEKLALWPWFPWSPWSDCTPDITFTVTQDCEEPGRVVLDEGWSQTRWNIPTKLGVSLVAPEACCIPRPDPTPEGDCGQILDVCLTPIDQIGGNIGALPAPIGYRSPGLVSIHGDRPYGGTVDVQGHIGSGIDYYRFEVSDDDGATWSPMPDSAAANFTRVVFNPPNNFTWVDAQDLVDGQLVYEAKHHYEANNPWGPFYHWTGHNHTTLLKWKTTTPFLNGRYRLRMIGFKEQNGNLIDPKILPICGDKSTSELVLKIDNRIVGPGSGHAPSAPDHPCGSGTIHNCTLEPETDFIHVAIVRNGALIPLHACGQDTIQAGDVLRIDFAAYDPEGHLANFSLNATYGENLVRNLLGIPHNLNPLGGAFVPAALQMGPDYGQARLQGAVAPIWSGGAFRYQALATDAFPTTCCYQLELRARKRTIVNCNGSFESHRNDSEYSFMITVP